MARHKKNRFAVLAAAAVLGVFFIKGQGICAKEGGETLTVALDPGHGGEEDGAVYYGRKEKELNLKLAKLVCEGFGEYSGVEVVTTRNGDETVSLEERAVRAGRQGADVLISLHFNASAWHGAKGATVYISTAEAYREDLLVMADCLFGEFEALGLQNNGTIARMTQLGGRRPDGSFDDYYGVLRHSCNNGMPSLLIEHCFMDSGDDFAFFGTEEGIRQLAQADVNGIAAYYGLKKKDGSPCPKRRSEKFGATTKGRELGYEEPPEVTGLSLCSFDGISPGLAGYRISLKDGVGIDALSLVYKSGDSSTVSVPLVLSRPLKTGTYVLKAYIPEALKTGDYQLSYIGAHNVAGYETGYNYASGEMLGFGKCQWRNRFPYGGEANLYVREQKKIAWKKGRWTVCKE